MRVVYRVKLLILYLLVFIVSGCQAGRVTVQDTTSNTKPSANPNPNNNHSSEKDQSRTPADPIQNQDMVFFITADFNFQRFPTVIGLNFLSSKSVTSHPFGFRLSEEQSYKDFFWAPIFVQKTYQLAWVDSPQNGGNLHLHRLDPLTFNLLDLGEVEPAVNWSISYNAEWITGIKADGTAFLRNIENTTLVPLPEKDLSRNARSFQLTDRKQFVIVDPLAHRIDLFSVSDPNQIIKTWKGDVFTSNPSGKLFVIADEHTIQIVNPASDQVTSIENQFGLPYFPTWKDDSTLAFISNTQGDIKIQILDINSQRIYPITSLSIQPQELNLVCPSWVKGRLYYANRTSDNLWTIWTINNPTEDTTHPELFVQPIDSSRGYVCPKVITS